MGNWDTDDSNDAPVIGPVIWIILMVLVIALLYWLNVMQKGPDERPAPAPSVSTTR